MGEIVVVPHKFKETIPAFTDRYGETIAERKVETFSGRYLAQRGSIQAFAGTPEGAVRMVEFVESRK